MMRHVHVRRIVGRHAVEDSDVGMVGSRGVLMASFRRGRNCGRHAGRNGLRFGLRNLDFGVVNHHSGFRTVVSLGLFLGEGGHTLAFTAPTLSQSGSQSLAIQSFVGSMLRCSSHVECFLLLGWWLVAFASVIL